MLNVNIWIANAAQKCIKLLYGFMILSILICCVLFVDIGYGRDIHNNYLPTLILIPFGMIFMFGILTCLEKGNFSSKYIVYIALILFAIQVYSTWNYYFYTDWDSSILTMFASAFAHREGVSGLSWYFSRYPNNIFLGVIFAGIEKIVHCIGLHPLEYFSLIVIQCAIVSITGVLLFKIIVGLLDNETFAYLGYILYTLIVGLSPWVSIPYSDAIGLFFPTMIYYLYINRNKHKNSLVVWMNIAVFTWIGYKIKPQVVILFIGIVLIEILSFIKEKTVYKKTIIGILLGIIIAEFGVNTLINKVPLTIDENQSFGIEHYFMMGMNSDAMGVYSEEDVQFSSSFLSKELRKKADLREAFMRINQMGVTGCVKQEIRKTLTNYNDGTFCWGGEGTFFVTVFDEKQLPGNNLLRGLYYTRDYADIGRYYSVWSNFEQMLWMTILVMNVVSIFAKKANSVNALMLGIVGLTIFELLFEARARYLFSYIPLYIVISIYGIGVIREKKISI